MHFTIDAVVVETPCAGDIEMVSAEISEI